MLRAQLKHSYVGNLPSKLRCTSVETRLIYARLLTICQRSNPCRNLERMRAVIQRVQRASVTIENETVGAIGPGLLILLGVEDADDETDVQWLAQKIASMRIFEDAEGKMNRSLCEVEGRALVVSQFTLHASTKKGNRPSFIQAARPEHAIPMYEAFLKALNALIPHPAATGQFGADMQVELINDGPVTIWIDTKNKA